MLRSGDWVLALPLTEDGRLVMVRQYRFGTRDLSTEAPGGIIERGEDPVLAAVRELPEPLRATVVARASIARA